MRLKVHKNLRIGSLNLKFIGSCQTNKSKLYNVRAKALIRLVDWCAILQRRIITCK